MQHDIHNFQTEYHQNYLTVDNGGVLPEPYSLPEVWVKVPTFLAPHNRTCYEFSNHFRVRNSKRNKVLKMGISTGYLRYSETFPHILSAYFYLGTPPDAPDGERIVVNHIDGNKRNPHPENLEYITETANIQHGVTLPPLEPLTDAQVELVESLFLDGLTRSGVLAETGFNYRQVSVIHRRLRATGEISDGYGLTPDEVEQIRDLYKEGKTSNELAEQFGVSASTILNRVKDIPSQSINFTGLSDELIEQIRELYKSGKSSYEIADMFGVNRSTVTNHVKDIPSQFTNFTGLSDELIEQIRELYKSGKSSYEIADMFGITPVTVLKYVKDIPSQFTNVTGLSDELVEQIRELYKQGLPSPKIAKQLGITATTVLKYVKDIPSKRTLTDELIEQIRELYKQGLSSPKIAKQLEITASTVCRYTKDIPSQHEKNRQQIIDLYNTGDYTQREIAYIIGYSYNAVWSIIKKYREQNDQ